MSKRIAMVGFGCSLLCMLAVLFPCFVRGSTWVISPFWIWLAWLIAALLCNHIALRRLRTELPAGGRAKAKALAVAGLVLAYATIPLQLVLNTASVR